MVAMLTRGASSFYNPANSIWEELAMFRMGNLLAAILLIACAVSAQGCNTVKGVGQDIQKAGEKIEGAAKK